jgi:hypothetical protein
MKRFLAFTTRRGNVKLHLPSNLPISSDNEASSSFQV